MNRNEEYNTLLRELDQTPPELEYTVTRWCGKENNVRTQIVFTFFAEFAMSAGLSRFQSHPVTYF